jgi:hypothetical protein
MGLNGNANLQAEFWKPKVDWIMRPNVITLLDEQPGARIDRGGEVLPESGRDILFASSCQDFSQGQLSTTQGGETILSAALMAAV